LVLALRRRESFTVPDPETVFQENDRVIVLSPAEALDRVNRVFRG
jgi:Trk K+ transport system NAD-binding subunit